MAKIAYILLCHKDPAAIVEQAERLTAVGDYMAIHFDASAPQSAYEAITKALKDNPNVVFSAKRVRCGWGEWSLVAATLHAIDAALSGFPDASHFYMLSGDCMAIKTAEYIHDYLDRNDADFIESFDYFESDWIKTGWKKERLIYRHWFNERTQKALFYAMFAVQKRLGLTRAIPDDLNIRIGSQWWCLRRSTIETVRAFAAKRPGVIRFFSSTWIPDETFFQTIVRHLIPSEQIRSRTLTFLLFTDYGMPVTFYNDHYDLLRAQDYLFARKISPEAQDLKQRLGQLYVAEGVTFHISNEGASLFKFLTERGRIGRRFASRFWESESSLGRSRELMIVVCKKWHVAKRLLEHVRQVTNVPTIEYLFNEQSSDLPDLGGIQTSLGKRHRHRRALMRMLFDYYETDRLIICLDPANLDLLQDFASDRARTKILEVHCAFSDAYLAGHAMRVGLAGAQTSPDALGRLLPTIRGDIEHESDRIRDEAFSDHYHLRETGTEEDNVAALAAFLAVGPDAAHQIAAQEAIFAD